MNNRVEQQQQGKLLGGSSAINGSAFVAPSPAGIDAWAKLGNPDWTYNKLLPYYQKVYSSPTIHSDTCQEMGVDYIDAGKTARHLNGPIKVSFPGLSQKHPVTRAWNDACRDMGYKTTAELFPTEAAGSRCYSAAIDPETGERSFAYSQYGLPASKRSNLTILTETMAQRVQFNSTSGHEAVAEGVEVLLASGSKQTIRANKEVIICAGALQTPKFLELSGVGSADRLKSLDIPVHISNPGVGENLQNHTMVTLNMELMPDVQPGNYIQTLTFLRLQDPEVQRAIFDKHHSAPEDAAFHAAVRSILDEPTGASAAAFMCFIGLPNFASVGVMQSIPFSRGACHIDSPDPSQSSQIDPRFFSNPVDLELLAHHLVTLEKLVATDKMARFFKRGGQRLPEGVKPITDLESAKSYLRDNATATYHSCGTAAMLPREDGGVVDQHFRVYGSRNLRVVDASVFPIITQANPMSTVYAVAERAADMIKSTG